jgi:YidC/Oxa1 family membrane protein insertase
VDNRRLLIAALLSMAVLVLWQVLFPPPRPAPRPPAPAVEATDAGAAEAAPAGGAAAAPAAPGASAAPAAAPPEAPLPAVAAEAEAPTVVETETIRAEFTNRGAQLVSLVARGRFRERGEPLELVQRRADSPYPFALVDAEGRPLALSRALFHVERSETAEGVALVFAYRGELGAAEKRFLVRPDGRIDFEVEAGAPGFGVLVGPGLGVHDVAALDNRQNPRGVVWSVGGEVDRAAPKDLDEPRELGGRALDWVGLEDTFFLAAMVPGAGVETARLEPVVLRPAEAPKTFDAVPLPADGELRAEEKQYPRDVRVVLVADDRRLEGVSYWGSKQYDRLAAMPWGLERTVRFGSLKILALPLLRALQWIHGHVVANYGWAIALLTTALKLALLPLSLAAFKSMRKMQKLQPRMQSIRERWRGKLRDKQGRFNADAQRQMNEEIMGLYRTEGVNPAGGCLPILVQLPIFFAFYTMLSTAVELKFASWLWVPDLTEPEPFPALLRPLPLLMGVSQVIQQRMTPPPPDPIQRKMLQAMPIVFTFFSLWFPSGLVLYWLTNNLWSIAQQALYNSFQNRHAEAAPAAAPRARGGKKR